MFEYLMPLLFTRTYPGTLLDESCRMAVRRQREWGRANGVPWGSSESAYRAVDLAGEHQYRAFGVPGLGFRRGLDEDLVVAPYATALAALLAPAEAAKNLRRLVGGRGRRPLGLLGRRGLHGGTRGGRSSAAAAHRRRPGRRRPHRVRAPPGNEPRRIRERAPRRRRWCGGFTPTRACAPPSSCCRSGPPRQAPVAQTRPSSDEVFPIPASPAAAPRLYRSPYAAFPATQFLSNGSFVTAITQAGGGWSSWRGLSVVRRRDDPTADPAGHALYLRDVRSGAVWSADVRPDAPRAGVLPGHVPARVRLHPPPRRRHRITPRRGRLSRGGRRGAPADSHESRALDARDRGHERRRGRPRLPAGRRRASGLRKALPRDGGHSRRTPRSSARAGPARPARPRSGRFTSSPSRAAGRARSNGRRTARASSAAGATPRTRSRWTAARSRARRGRSSTRSSACASGCGSRRARSRASCSRPASRRAGRPPSRSRRSTTTRPRPFAPSRWPVRRRRSPCGTSASPPRTRACSSSSPRASSARTARLAAPARRARRERPRRLGAVAARHLRGPPDPDGAPRAHRGPRPRRQTLEAQEYWRLKGLAADLVLLNEHPEGYRKELHDAPHGARRARSLGLARRQEGRRSSCSAATSSSPDEQRGLLVYARAILRGEDGDLALQLDRTEPWAAEPPPPPAVQASPEIAPPEPLPRLEMANGYGGFGEGGRTYEIVLDGDRETPHPWANVLANPSFGSLVTASGPAMTWSTNSRENRLTPFANDAVSDPPSEAIVVRDEETGEVVGATPGARTARQDRPLADHARTRPLPVPKDRRRHRAVDGHVRRTRGAREDLPPHAREPLGPGPPSRGLRRRRLGARPPAPRGAPPRRHVARAGRAGPPRAQSGERRVRGTRRVPRVERAARVVVRGPARVPRSRTDAAHRDGAAPRAPFGADGRRARPVCGAPRVRRSRPGRDANARLRARRGARRGPRARPRRAIRGRHRRRRRARARAGRLGGDAGHAHRDDARRLARPAREPLAPLPDHRVAPLGAHRLFPARRGVGLP